MEEQDRKTSRPEFPWGDALQVLNTVVGAGFDEPRWCDLERALERTLPWARRRLVDRLGALAELLAPARAREDILLVVPESVHGRPAIEWIADLREQGCAAPAILVTASCTRLEDLGRCSPLALLDAGRIADEPLRLALLHVAHIDRLQRSLAALRRSLNGIGEQNEQLARNLREASRQLAEKTVEAELQEGAGGEPPLFTRIDQRVRQARQRDLPLCCVLLRLEGLADLADAYEAAFVDFVLVQAAHRLKRRVRSSDLVARYGHGAFVVLSYGLTHQRALAQIRRLASALTIERFGHLFLPKVSIGLAFLSPEMEGSRDLLKAAERAVAYLGTWAGAGDAGAGPAAEPAAE